MIKVIYTGKDFKNLEKEVLKAFKFVSKYFLTEIPNITVRIYGTRSGFDKYMRTKTASWLVANASDNNEIAILSPKAMEKESSHRKNEFLPILKHEFTHILIDKIAVKKTVPKWLEEGLAQYIAKQYKNTSYPKEVEDNFCKKLGTTNGWQKRIDSYAYQISALFVCFLIKEYSFKKIKELLFLLEKEYKYPRFKKIFFKVYATDLSEVEKIFIKSTID